MMLTTMMQVSGHDLYHAGIMIDSEYQVGNAVEFSIFQEAIGEAYSRCKTAMLQHFEMQVLVALHVRHNGISNIAQQSLTSVCTAQIIHQLSEPDEVMLVQIHQTDKTLAGYFFATIAFVR